MLMGIVGTEESDHGAVKGSISLDLAGMTLLLSWMTAKPLHDCSKVLVCASLAMEHQRALII